ncbi:XRE family transcriptional regulator [Chitinophaga sp. sic0106]|uniref:XRE family transcriptional regulator n=1 Tax=Chitinophaga sp. sic0106 TaxID=2854785 RepID=UPI001C47495F|nr:XRE family transcriptional regulator [Chitinophaga sp. sic0106]MBV7529018.1 XRE family transcriptional regulator [Chitinophaga sp. sic0106]
MITKELLRLKIAIGFLKKLDIIKNQGDIATDLGYKRQGTISEIVKGKIPITDKFLTSFCSKYGVDIEYIKTGNGEVFPPGSPYRDQIEYKELLFQQLDIIKKELIETPGLVPELEDQKNSQEVEPDIFWRGVPMYDTDVNAGILSLIRDEKITEPAYYLPIPGFKDCKFGARVSGDSMYPEIRNGDYVICKELQTLDSLIYGDIYLVVTHDGMETVKYVHPHEKEDWINLVPYNKSVPTTPMPKKNIRAVYKVKGVVKGY